MTLDEAIKRYIDNAEYERTHGNLQGCLEFQQLAEWLKDYKRLLEQEPCEDAVSRKALINAFPISETYTLPDIIATIKSQTSVTPTREKGKWISVEEEAPPKGTICLWCNKQGSVFTSEITYRSECDSYVGKHGYFSNGLENHGDIVAWMPLPEPYEEG